MGEPNLRIGLPFWAGQGPLRTAQRGVSMSLGQTAPVIIVSADSHVGPRLREDLRGYCPARHLDDYDALIAQTGPIVNGQARLAHPNAPPGHYYPASRLADMDSDGPT